MQAPSRTMPQAPAAYLALAALPSAPFWARRHTRLVLTWWGVHPGAIETAELLVSELVTNAQQASGPHEPVHRYSELAKVGRISLVLRHLGRAVRIEVADPETSPPVRAATGPDAESGRGLMIVEALAAEWGYYYPAPGGKVVYAVIDASWASQEGPAGEQ